MQNRISGVCLVLLAVLSVSAGCLAGPGGSETANQPPVAGPQVEDFVPMQLSNHGAAPEFQNDVWLNTDRPLRLDDLKGKVVLVDMWTFG